MPFKSYPLVIPQELVSCRHVGFHLEIHIFIFVAILDTIIDVDVQKKIAAARYIDTYYNWSKQLIISLLFMVKTVQSTKVHDFSSFGGHL